jgi:hypothetical protein
MKQLGALMFSLAAATLAHEASAADLSVCASGCPFPTIQSAINSSHANDVIRIAAGTYFENLLVPNQRLTLVGAGQDLTVIDGRRRGSVVTLGAFGGLTTAQTVSIVAVTITHGSAQFGGGILVNNAALDLQNSIVSSNAATQSGGGIDLGASTVPAKITGTMVVHNRAAGAGGGISVEAECVAQISNSSITRNTAGRAGGGVFAEGASPSKIQGTTISDNTSQADGGGVFVDSGLPKPTMSIASSSIVGNRAAGTGGGLFNEGHLTIGVSVVDGNNVPADTLP